MKKIQIGKLKRIRLKKEAPVDFGILVITLILVIFGIVMIFSASYYNSINMYGTPFSFMKKQVMFAIIGFILMAIFARIDYHFWKKLMPLIMIISLGLLVAVIAGFGVNINGATRWIKLGPLSIMPGEIAKFAIIIFAATFLSADVMRSRSFIRGGIPVILVTGVFAALIIKQPNLSTALTLLIIAVGMLFLGGINWKWFVGGLVVFAGGIAVLAKSGTYWAIRIKSFTDPFADPQGEGYQVVQSLLALGSGGLFGVGLGNSVQKNLYLPEPQNDFITAIIGEELGLVGILLMLAGFMILIFRIFVVAIKSNDRFGMYIAGGTGIMFGVQVVMNIAVATSSMPPTGIALPFISYGGNALWICMGLVGIVLNISRQTAKKEAMEKAENSEKKEYKGARLGNVPRV